MQANPRLTLVRDVPPAEPLGDMGVEAVFRRFAPYVARIALRLLGRHGEVDDVVQDVFVEAVRGLGTVRDPQAVKGWLAAVTVRVAGRRLKVRRLKRWMGMEAAPHHDCLEAPGASPEERALLACVYNVLNQVPVPARTAWILRHVEGERLESIATACSCSLATAKRRIAAAQAALDEALGDEGSEEADQGRPRNER